jgi:predicted MFS family arabinose efflux permease
MTDVAAGAPGNKLAAPGLTDSSVRYGLWLLLVIYTLNFVDRQIVAVLGEDIKRDLGLTDTQLGLLGGLAFALFYTFLGIPIARIAERGNRVGIISAALVVWSGFTALCGTATSFWQILLYRFGVGVGEAGCTPPAHSLISDYVKPEKRASALALYSMGVPIGTFGGFAIGAIIAANYGWRAAFFMVGLPGVLLGILAFFTLKEPRKLGLSLPPTVKTHFGEALKELRAIPSYWFAVLGATVVSFLGYGHAYFLQAFLARVHGMELQERGVAFAFMVLIAGVLGTWAGGKIADSYAKKDARAYVILPAIAFALGTPFFLAAMFWPVAPGSGYIVLLWLAIPTAMNSVWYGPVYAAIQGLVKPHTRATAVAVMFFILNLIALGLGPTTIGYFSDVFAAQHFGAATAAAFEAACPPGGAEAACLAAQAEGIRLSLLVTSGVIIIGLLCFWMSSRTIRADLARAQAAA